MMSDCHSALLKLFVLLCGLFCITPTLALPVDSTSHSPPLGALVPTIEQEGFRLTPEGNGYKLFLYVPEGNFRTEDVTLINNKELSVKGDLYQVFGRYVYTAEYVADGHGYRVKSSYKLAGPPTTMAPRVLLSAKTLMSAGG